MLKRSFTIHGGDIFLNGFLLARPSQDVFLLLPLIPWIEQGGSVYFLLRYSMIFLNVYEVDWLHYDTYISVFLIIQRSDSLDNVDADYGITDNKIWVIMKV